MAFEKFKGKRFTQVTASRETKGKEPYRKIPASLRLGKKSHEQGGFFDYNGILLDAMDKNRGSNTYSDNSVIVQEDPSTKEIGVFVHPTIYRNMMNKFLLTASLASHSFTNTTARQCSASFFRKLGDAVTNLPATEYYVNILAAPFEEGSTGKQTAIIPPPTASLIIKQAPGIAYDENGAIRNRRITYINSSSNFTNSHFQLTWSDETDYDTKQANQTTALVNANLSHLTRSFGVTTGFSKNKFLYVQSRPIREFSFHMSSSNTTSSFFALTASFSSSADFGLVSGNLVGPWPEIKAGGVRPKYYNGINNSDGEWVYVVQRGFVEGEGEFGENEANSSQKSFLPQQLAVWYSPNYYYSNVRSASFYHTPYPLNMDELNTGVTTKNLVTSSIASNEVSGSGELTTLFWLNHTYTSSFTASFGYSTRVQLKERTGEANHTQLPYMNTSINYFGRKQRTANSSHLWKDKYLSIPANEGYYVHSASFSSQSKAEMAKQFGHENHTGSFYVLGAFKHTFIPALDVINYSASQFRESTIDAQSWLNHHPIASCMFLKRYDDSVFVFHPSASGFVTSESVG